MNLIKKMEELIKEKLNENVEFDKILSLNILYLKYKMILETKDYGSLYVLKYFCYDRCYDHEIKQINEHYNIDILVNNPFKSQVLDELNSSNLIDISSFNNNKGDICISTSGINYLKKYYNIDSENLFTNMVVFNTINITNINITNTINNITNGLSDDDRDFFISILKDFGKNKDSKSFVEKLKEFSKKVGEDVLINVISNMFNPENISKILDNLPNF